MTENEHVLDLIPALTLGGLDAEEASRVEEHLAGCLICRSESAALTEVTAQLGYAPALKAPSPDLKRRLMDRVQGTRRRAPSPSPAPARPWYQRLLPAWGIASLLLLLTLGAANLALWQRLTERDFFTAPGGMRAVPLVPTGAVTDATGFVLVSANGDDGALVVDGLPQLGETQEYQLWLIRNGERTSGAVFSTDENNYGGTRIRAPRSLLDYSAVGITIEPAGGSSQPTGERVLGGPLVFP